MTARPWVALLAAGAVAAAPAPAIGQERVPEGVRDLWREYPVGEDDAPATTPAPAPRAGSADSSSPPARPAAAPARAAEGEDEDGGGVPLAAPLAVLAVAVAGAGALALRSARRRPAERRVWRPPGRTL